MMTGADEDALVAVLLFVTQLGRMVVNLHL